MLKYCMALKVKLPQAGMLVTRIAPSHESVWTNADPPFSAGFSRGGQVGIIGMEGRPGASGPRPPMTRLDLTLCPIVHCRDHPPVGG